MFIHIGRKFDMNDILKIVNIGLSGGRAVAPCCVRPWAGAPDRPVSQEFTPSPDIRPLSKGRGNIPRNMGEYPKNIAPSGAIFLGILPPFRKSAPCINFNFFVEKQNDCKLKRALKNVIYFIYYNKETKLPSSNLAFWQMCYCMTTETKRISSKNTIVNL